MKHRSHIDSKEMSSTQELHEDHLLDISSQSSSKTEPFSFPLVNLDLSPTIVVSTTTTITNIQEKHENHLSDISSQSSSKTEPSSRPPVNNDLLPTVVAGTATTNTNSSTTESNSDSPRHPNSQSVLLGLISHAIATIQYTVITSAHKDTIK
jgi:hypothetical protein